MAYLFYSQRELEYKYLEYNYETTFIVDWKMVYIIYFDCFITESLIVELTLVVK